MNPLTLCDGYKLGHRAQYPAGTEYVLSNWTPRSTFVDGQKEVVAFGFQYFIKEYIQNGFEKFFNSPDKYVTQHNKRIASYLGIPEEKVDSSHWRKLYELGHVPLRFCAVSEGTLVPLRVPMLTVENTHPDFFWLVNYIETIMSNILWLPCTSATTAMRYRELFDRYAIKTGGDTGFVDWQGHDFSFRGMAGLESAMLSGAGHLLSFAGTDTIPAIDFVEKYYGEVMAGSVPATEHSVMCAGGCENELETFDRLLTLYPEGVVSVVSDTWDLWKVCTEILPKLKDRIMARNGKLVIRPDSGDPVKILCGDVYLAKLMSPKPFPEDKGVIELLWDVFGGTTNEKGYKVLDSHIGAIYGDSITYDRAKQICERLEAKGFASTNVVLGIGSFTYQHVTRDTYGHAMKATHAVVNGEGRNLFKKPVTDNGGKFSATGRLAVFDDGTGKLNVKEMASKEDELKSELRPIWENSHFLRTTTFSMIKNRLKEQREVYYGKI